MRKPIDNAACAAGRIAALGISAVWVLLASLSAAGEEPARGLQIYTEKCASCHGEKGEGSIDYPHPLVGDKSAGELTQFITENMPKDSPGECVGEEARAVARYVHDAFYSKIAQARLRPPRVELSRLTVRQYRNALADLVGGFRPARPWEAARGLRGEYTNSRRFRDGQKAIDRVDPQVRFDFRDSSPDPEKLDPHAFSVRWTGSVIAPESGNYEFVLRTDHSAKLFVNDREYVLLDAWVKSGSETEYRASIELLAGRAYPLRMDFSKSKQGVDDSKDKKDLPPPAPAFIELCWRRPHLPVEVIPERYLMPQEFPETFVAVTPFPPDDRSTGFERGSNVSKAWDQAATDAAVETANYVAAHLPALSGAAEDAGDRQQRLAEFCRRFVERAFRRPLRAEEQQAYIDRRFAASEPAIAVQQVVLLALKSPSFLYHESAAEPENFAIATRLSLGLWDSLPDEALTSAAAAGQLSTPEQISAQAQRMLQDPRFAAKLRQFLLELLKVDPAPEITKDQNLFANFDAATAADLRTSLELFIAEWMSGDRPDFRQLLLSPEVYLNGPLAKWYGANLPQDAPFQKVTLEPDRRAGVLTHPYLLARFAYNGTSSPIHRGLFVARSLLGRVLRPPPEAVAPLAPDLHPDLSTRERVTLQTGAQTCQMCHRLINPLGFTLEHFDAVGRFRDAEQGRPIDASGAYETREGKALAFDGARPLAEFLANSEEAQSAFVEHLFHHFIKQSIYAYGPESTGRLRSIFVQHDCDVHRLLVEMMVLASRPPAAPN